MNPFYSSPDGPSTTTPLEHGMGYIFIWGNFFHWGSFCAEDHRRARGCNTFLEIGSLEKLKDGLVALLIGLKED